MNFEKRIGFLARLLIGAAGGAAFGTALLGIGLLRAAVAMARGIEVSSERLSITTAALYVGSFTAGGVVVGALWSFTGTRVGTYVVAILGMAAAMVGIMVLVTGPLHSWDVFDAVTWLVLSILFGSAVAYGLRHGKPAA